MPINLLTEEGFGMIVGAGGGGNDTDAQAFIDAAGITGETQQAALNQLVLDLKGTGSTTNNTDVWSKIYALYPFCPIDDSTATLSAYELNLKDPRDLDAAFRITWVNTPTATLNGIQGNGTNQYGNTHWNPNSEVGSNRLISYGISSNTNSATGAVEIGCSDGTSIFLSNFLRNTSTSGFFFNGVNTYSETSTDGVFIATNDSSGNVKVYKNGNPAPVQSYNEVSTSVPNFNIYLLARNVSGSSSFYSARQLDFSFIANILTANEAKDLYDAINTFNSTLSR